MTTAAVVPDSSSTPFTALSLPHLPNEILRLIFEHLTHRFQQQDIASLRLVCKLFADIGNSYLLSDVYLFAKSSQLEQLRQISEHPIISTKVNTLIYEVDLVLDYPEWQIWFDVVGLPGPNNMQRPASPPPTASRREWRAYIRKLNEYSRRERRPRLFNDNYRRRSYIYSEPEMERAYVKHLRYSVDRERIRLSGYNREMLKDVMMKLPNLKSIELTTPSCLYTFARLMKVGQASNDSMTKSYLDSEEKEGCGVGQLRALLLAADAANLRFETLSAGNLDWRFFMESTKQNAEVMRKVQRALRSVRTLKLYVWYGAIYDSDHAFSRSPHLKNFITATPGLERLDINFAECMDPLPPVSLCDSVGAYKWHSLRVVAFTRIRANEDCLVRFFDRHAGTLRKLRLDSIVLALGNWPSLLRRARKTLSLEQARICGRLSSLDPFASFFFDLPAGLNDGKRARAQVVIEKYLIHRGDAPLLNLRRITEALKDQYVASDSDWPSHLDTESDEAIIDCY